MPSALPHNASYPRIHPMGEAALLISLGNRISDATNDRVMRLYEALRDTNLGGIGDLVPAFSSLLIRFDPERLSETELRAKVEGLLHSPVPLTARKSRTHVVPVQYGGEAGPDLACLARSHGLTVSEVVRLHTQRIYRVYFLGFMPGFAYMGRLASEITTPRLETPRVRVPAGSVGIAGAQTGVYPFSSPGGWRIIGRTDERIWDLDKSPPALFAPGDRVRFMQNDSQTESQAYSPASLPAPNPVFEVVSSTAPTTVQDLGRPGYGHLGLCEGGAFDKEAAIRANALLGNPAGSAVLELTWTGPTLVARRATTIALDGADFGCYCDGNRVPPSISWFVRAGSVLRFDPGASIISGARAYLAVAGGFDVPPVLGSRSTYLPAGFGGFEGRALREGDVLGANSVAGPVASLAGHRWPVEGAGVRIRECVLRFTRYAGEGSAGEEAAAKLAEGEWAVSTQTDRMGTRLQRLHGPRFESNRGDLASFGVVQGAIQLPPGGQPVVLGVDHQTTGGYPVVGVVAQADGPILAQSRPGDTVRFDEIGLDAARVLRKQTIGRLREELRAPFKTLARDLQ